MFCRLGFWGRVWLRFAALSLKALFFVAFGSVSGEQPAKLAAAVRSICSVFRDTGRAVSRHFRGSAFGVASGCSSR
jgi:hypothetical protein